MQPWCHGRQQVASPNPVPIPEHARPSAVLEQRPDPELGSAMARFGPPLVGFAPAHSENSGGPAYSPTLRADRRETDPCALADASVAMGCAGIRLGLRSPLV